MNLKRGIYEIVTVVLCFILQTAGLARIGVFSVLPNLIVVPVAAFGFMRGELNGLLIGAFAGLLTDIFFGPVVGLYTLLYMALGYLNGKLHAIFYPSDLFLPFLSVAGSDLLLGLSQYAALFLLRGRFAFSYFFLRTILPETVFTLLSMLFLYPALLFFDKRLSAEERKKEKKFV